MFENEIYPSDEDPLEHSTAARSTTTQQDTVTESPATQRGRRPSRATSRTPRRRGLPSPPPSRHPPSPASSYSSVQPTIPAIEKWTVLGLRQVLISVEDNFSRRINKAKLYNLYVSLQAASPSPKSTPPSKTTNRSRKHKDPNSRSQKTPSPTELVLPRAPGHCSRPSASPGRAPVPATAAIIAATQPNSSLCSAEPETVGVFQHCTPGYNTSFLCPRQSFKRKYASASSSSFVSQPFPVTFSNPFPWPAAPPSNSSARLPPLAVQAQLLFVLLSFPLSPFSHSFFVGDRLKREVASASGFRPLVFYPPNTFSQTSAPFTLFSATQMPFPPNSTALELPPVASNIRAQILTEIQAVGARGGPIPIPNPSTKVLRANIPINHPLRPLIDASLNSILQAISPRTLQSYLTAWKCFKSFHSIYKLNFPDYSSLTITSFISYLNSTKNLQVSSIKGYLSGIQFFHKLAFGLPSPEISNSQTSMLIKGIQKTQPTHPDARQPITLDILTKCISTLRRGYHSTNTARTLDAMFILAFFGFLRSSEITITSTFNPKLHPTISDLAVLDNETISYFIKQSKTDQMKKGHSIYIFNLPSPIQPYQSLLAYLHFRSSQTKLFSEPLFTDDTNRPVTRFWFQKHLKSILILSGISADNFSSHSFRIGAATTAAQKGLSQHQIQKLGCWSSEAFKSYIRSNRSHIKEAQQTLIS
ncbi:uncharacterized protein [Pseudorasbora parva]|uniref:uncharacterized protein n=1 Tax=Pseudorasbora parva TaxID=51549 RepID=UPI00351F105F